MTQSMRNDAFTIANRVRLDTLLKLRWIVMSGEAIVLLIITVGLGLEAKLTPILSLVGIYAVSNIFLQKYYPPHHRLKPEAATALFSFDVVLFTLLLYQTGGLTNPFAILYVVPVIISAGALPPRWTIQLGALTIICASLLVNFHEPLPWFPGDEFKVNVLYLAGNWAAIVLTIFFAAFFTLKIESDNRNLSAALKATERAIEREKRLSSLDGLAAAAAHELGTPLSTIALVAQELANSPSNDKETHEDLILILDEVDRCRTLLTRLSGRIPDSEKFLQRVPIDVFLDKLATRARKSPKEFELVKKGHGPEPTVRMNAPILMALTNVIDNATEFAATTVKISVFWDRDQLALEVRDDGPGFAQEVLPHIGQPYISTRKTIDRSPHSIEGGGLGLGMFIAKTLIKRSGASVQFLNSKPPQTGAITRVTWKMSDICEGE